MEKNVEMRIASLVGTGKIKQQSCKALNISTKTQEQQGIVEAFVSVYDVIDSYNERVKYGAFTESLTQFMPKVLNNHDWRDNIGKTVVAREVAPFDAALPQEIKAYGGLWVQGQLNLEKQNARDVFSDLAGGYKDEFSIGYSVQSYSYDQKTGIIDLTKLTLYEWSSVLFGANPATVLTALKSLPMTVETQFELTRELIGGFKERLEAIREYREKEGRTFSTANYNRLSQLASDIDTLALELRDIINTGTDAKAVNPTEVEALILMSQNLLKGYTHAS